MLNATPRLLIVDDDERLRERLVRAMRSRGIETESAHDADSALAAAASFAPSCAVLDLRMPGGSGLELLRELRKHHPDLRAVILTGYGSIATAVTSMRDGAADYLTKPADAEQVLGALGISSGASRAEGTAADPEPPSPDPVPSLERVEWEHIQRVLSDCSGNVSQAARVLGLHRRTLQRKLATFPPRR